MRLYSRLDGDPIVLFLTGVHDGGIHRDFKLNVGRHELKSSLLNSELHRSVERSRRELEASRKFRRS